jgi:hypothetical protein
MAITANYVEFKVTELKRISFDTLSPVDQIKAQQMVKDGISFIDIIEEFDLKIEDVHGSMKNLPIEKNDYDSTVELYKNNCLTWKNDRRMSPE